MQYADFTPFDETHLIHSIRGWRKYAAYLRVGWLGGEYDFPVGKMDHEVLAELWRVCLAPAVRFKGYEMCPLCKQPWGPTSVTFAGNSAEIGCGIIAVESQPGVLLMAPDLIIHYVLHHSYQPPSELLEAICAGGSVEFDASFVKSNSELLQLLRKSEAEDNQTRSYIQKTWDGVAKASMEMCGRVRNAYCRAYKKWINR